MINTISNVVNSAIVFIGKRKNGSRIPHGVLLPVFEVNLAFAIYSVVENQAISKTTSKNKQADAHAN